ncbi:MAG TPA: hypothetical protein VF222_07305 [Nitrososphaeraceae archaeon]
MTFNETCFTDTEIYLNYEEHITLLPKMVSNTKKYKKTSKSNSNSIELYDLIAIKFPGEGQILSGFITIKYRYNLKNGIITYSDIKYSDKRMERYLEEQPNVIKNIDSYLKNKMLESELKSI